MKRRQKVLTLVPVFLLILVPVIAQEQGRPKTVFEAATPPVAVSVGPMAFEQGIDIRAVTGAAYSAEGMTEAVQVLADGNRIVRRNSTRVARDSQGRTRMEYSFTPPGGQEANQVTMISINDPITGVTYTLHPETRTADKLELPHVVTHQADGAGAVLIQEGRGEHGAVAHTGAQVFIHKQPGLGPVAAVAAGVPASHVVRLKMAMAHGGADAGVTEQLGKQLIEGLEAEGTRTTLTIPAGQIGNEQPIVITSEQWYSPELQTIIYSKRDDPMAGTTIYRLTNIVRSEPDPALFQVPAEYTIESSEMRMRTLERKLESVKPQKK